jgi:hypothetical protein
MDTKVDDLNDPKSFTWFMKNRCRGWAISDKPIGTRLPGLDDLHGGCSIYSAGEATKSACMMTRGIAHILTWMNIMHHCPLATEKSDVNPGEHDSSIVVDPDSLTSTLVVDEIPGSKAELCSLGFRYEKDIAEMTEAFVASVKFTDGSNGSATFFNDRMKRHNNEMMDDDEVNDDYNCDISIIITPPPASEVTSSVPSAHDAAPPVAAPLVAAPLVAAPLVAAPNAAAGVPDAPPAAPPVTAPDAVVEGTYDDVIRGQVGPFDLGDLQDIREEAEE